MKLVFLAVKTLNQHLAISLWPKFIVTAFRQPIQPFVAIYPFHILAMSHVFGSAAG